jgi:diguanylate cyclase (GGDEF)-like protein
MLQHMKSPQPAEQFDYAWASSRERLTALVATFALVGLGLVSILLPGVAAPQTPALLPCTTAAGLVALLVSCAILRSQYRASGFAPFGLLAVAYGACATLIVPYLLIYPGVLSPSGFGLGPQVAAWLWVGWHAAFVLLAGVYVCSDACCSRVKTHPVRVERIVSVYALAAVAAAALAVMALCLFHDRLPVLVTKTGYTPLFHVVVGRLLFCSTAALLGGLAASSRLRGTIHLWLGVVLVAFGLDTGISGAVVRHPFTYAWVVGLGQGLIWQSLFLVIQLQRSNKQLVAFANDRRELIEETLRDALTGLHNRRGFDARLEEAIRQSRLARTPLSILVLDLDHFKSYNDHFGHLAGDEALRAIAKTIGGTANRGSDVCCRVGGEEFAVVLPMTDEPSALTVAERVRASVMWLHLPHAPNVPLPSVTVSIGVASCDGNSSISPRALYELADNALYRAKRLGRNRIAVAPFPFDSGKRRAV